MKITNTPTGIEINHRDVDFVATNEAVQDIKAWGIDLPVFVENAIDQLIASDSKSFSLKVAVEQTDDSVSVVARKA